MNMKRNISIGFRRVTAVAAGIVVCVSIVVCASIFIPTRVSAQNPGLGSGKTTPSIPIKLEDISSRTATEYIVETGEVIRNILLTGELKAERAVVINAPRTNNNSSSSITFLADEGSYVKAGQRIVEYDDSNLVNNRVDQERNVQDAITDIANQKASLESQRCDLMNSLSQAEANVKTAELDARVDRSLRSENEYERFQLSLLRAQLNLEKAKENMANFEANYDAKMAVVEITRSQREIQLQKTDNDIRVLKVNSPIDGIFLYGDNWQSNRKVQVGDSIFSGMEVASIPDLDSMQVVGYVYDTEYRLLGRGMRCEVSFDALPDYKVDARIVSLTSVASRRGFATEKKLFQAIVRLDKIDSEILKPGMTARITVPLVLAEAAVSVPREYVGVDTQGRNYVVKIVDAKKNEKEFVNIGAVGDNLIEITSGLSAGEKLLPVRYITEVTKK